MPTTTSHEHRQAPAKTAGTKAGKASTGNILDDAPLFAGLDDFVLIQTEKKKTGTPKAVQPKEKAETGQISQVASGESIPQKPLKTRKGRKIQPPDPNALLLSVAEMCALLKISRATLVRMDKSGKLPGRIKLGGSVRFHRETVEAWLKSLITSPNP